MTAALVEVPRVAREVPYWHDDALCREVSGLDWIEAKRGSVEEQACRLICSACPVRLDCAVGALERRESWGVWGGLTRDDRKAIAARYGYLPPGDPPAHGTNARRVKWGCNCLECRQAHALYEAMRRERVRREGGLRRPPRLAAVPETAVPAAPVPAERPSLDLSKYRRRTRARVRRRRR